MISVWRFEFYEKCSPGKKALCCLSLFIAVMVFLVVLFEVEAAKGEKPALKRKQLGEGGEGLF